MKQHLIDFCTYIAEFPTTKSGLSKGALAGIILGTIAGSVTLSAIISLLILRRHNKNRHTYSKRRPCEYLPIFCFHHSSCRETRNLSELDRLSFCSCIFLLHFYSLAHHDPILCSFFALEVETIQLQYMKIRLYFTFQQQESPSESTV